MFLVFSLLFIQTLIMSKKMTFVEYFNVIDIALENLEGVVDVIRNMHHEEICELFRKA